MTPGEEARELRKEPLPPGEEDEHILTRIYTVDNLIETTKRDLAALQTERAGLITRAEELNIKEQDDLVLLYKYRTTRILDVRAFKEKYPLDAMTIAEKQREELIRQAEKVGDTIPLTMADALVGKEKVSELCDLKVEGTPYVQAKGGSRWSS